MASNLTVVGVLSDFKINVYTEPAFAEAFKTASAFSGLGFYRMYQLWAAVGQSKKLPQGDILEVGVYKGGSSLILQQALEHFQIPCRLVACDTFKGLVKAADGVDVWKTGEMVHADEAGVRELLPKALVLAGVFPDETGAKVADRTFRFAHIDVDTYQSAKDIWDWIWPRLVSGGILIFDDCEISDTPGITKLIGELEETPGSFWVRNHMGQALCVKTTAPPQPLSASHTSEGRQGQACLAI